MKRKEKKDTRKKRTAMACTTAHLGLLGLKGWFAQGGSTPLPREGLDLSWSLPLPLFAELGFPLEDLSLAESLFPVLGKAAALQPSSLPGREEDGLGGSSATYGLY